MGGGIEPHVKTHRENTLDDRSRVWSDVSTSQEMTRISGKHQSLKERGRILMGSEGAWASQYLGFRLLTSVRKFICCFQPPSFWHFVTVALRDYHREETRFWTHWPVSETEGPLSVRVIQSPRPEGTFPNFSSVMYVPYIPLY